MNFNQKTENDLWLECASIILIRVVARCDGAMIGFGAVLDSTGALWSAFGITSAVMAQHLLHMEDQVEP